MSRGRSRARTSSPPRSPGWRRSGRTRSPSSATPPGTPRPRRSSACARSASAPAASQATRWPRRAPANSMTGRKTCSAATTSRCSAVAKGKGSRAVLAADSAAAEAALPYQGSPAMRALGHFASLGDQPPLRTLCAAVIAAGLAGGDRRLARAGLRMLAAHSLATLAKDFVKHRVDRTRPRSKGRKGKGPAPKPGRHKAKEETSFPSGHSAGAAAVARAFARDYPEHQAPAYAAAGALALAQIPRCAHYPTDVGAGLLIGILAETAVDIGYKLVEERLGPA